MTMTDPVADLLTRIRNAVSIDRKQVDMPHSRLKDAICAVLKREGFITDYRVTEEPFKTLHVFLKYGPDGERLISRIERMSKPGCRVYCPAEEVPTALNGLGVVIVSTSKGLLTDRECRERKIGGELLCRVW